MKKLKLTVIIVVVLAVVIAIVPYQCGLVLRDGGSQHWQALTWEIHHYHRMMPIESGEEGWFEGWRISVFGHTIRDDYYSRFGHS